MNIKIVKAVLLLTESSDKITLHTELSCPFVPAFLPSQPPLGLDFTATHDTGLDYCRNVLGIEPEIINVRHKR